MSISSPREPARGSSLKPSRSRLSATSADVSPRKDAGASSVGCALEWVIEAACEQDSSPSAAKPATSEAFRCTNRSRWTSCHNAHRFRAQDLVFGLDAHHRRPNVSTPNDGHSNCDEPGQRRNPVAGRDERWHGGGDYWSWCAAATSPGGFRLVSEDNPHRFRARAREAELVVAGAASEGSSGVGAGLHT